MNGSLKAIHDDFDITSDKCLYSSSISKKSSILAFHQLIQIRWTIDDNETPDQLHLYSFDSFENLYT